MTGPCAGLCSDSKAGGGSWVGPVTEATVASNAASGAETKQARSVFSLLGLAIIAFAFLLWPRTSSAQCTT